MSHWPWLPYSWRTKQLLSGWNPQLTMKHDLCPKKSFCLWTIAVLVLVLNSSLRNLPTGSPFFRWNLANLPQSSAFGVVAADFHFCQLNLVAHWCSESEAVSNKWCTPSLTRKSNVHNFDLEFVLFRTKSWFRNIIWLGLRHQRPFSKTSILRMIGVLWGGGGEVGMYHILGTCTPCRRRVSQTEWTTKPLFSYWNARV